jgi:hypothetical protein
MNVKKIAHISLLPICSVGIANKENSCAEDAKRRGLYLDYIVITPEINKQEFSTFPYLKVYYVNGKNKIILRIKQFLKLKELLKEYDGVFLRYPGADVGAFILGTNLNNCIAEHHTLFIEEQMLTNPFRAKVEKFFGSFWLSFFLGHIGVTQQILDDVLTRSIFLNKIKVRRVLSNPYNFSETYRNGFFEKKEKYQGVISASSFMPWHGLDRILGLFEHNNHKFSLYVVGDVGALDVEKYSNYESIKFVGKKPKKDLDEIYNNCDFAFNSFGLDRLGMVVGSTLKIREYYDYSLPVISPLPDSGLPPDFRFLSTNCSNLSDIEKYLDSLSEVPLKEIKEQAKKHLGVESFNDAMLNVWN